MNKMNRILILCVAAFGLAACGGNEAQQDASTAEVPDKSAVDKTQVADSTRDDGFTTIPATPASIFRFDYKVIGTPIVGQPVAIDLQFESSLGDQTFDVSYRVNDATALDFPESQVKNISISPSAGEGKVRRAAQQVTVIPMREGRLYLNVAAKVEGDAGSLSNVIAVPIQVGQAPRELVQDGSVTTDENGELIRSLPAEEN